jgi:hypothetical protein
MSGTDKLRLVVIGKYKNPRCFKGIIRKPVDYYHNQKAWMTSETFTNILSKFNKKLIKEERKVLLFLDNCSCHSENLIFSNIKIIFLPKNSTSVLQPCDAGIIKCIKGQYRTQLVKHLIAYLDNEKNSVPAINLLDAIYMLSASWRKISENTIKNCFIKCGFVKDTNQEIEIVGEVANEEQNNIWQTYTELIGAQEIHFETYITVDNELATSEEVSEENFFNSVSSNNDRHSDTDDTTIITDEECDDNSQEIIKPSFRDVIKAMSVIKLYVGSHQKVDDSIFQEIEDLESKLVNLKLPLKQSLITNFFN